MSNGLDIGINEFKGMRSLDRDTLIYNNLVYIRKRLSDYKLHKKIQYVWLSVLTTGLLILFGIKKFVGV